MKDAVLAPSILAADFAKLGEQVARVAVHADRIHADVMDGHFVPNLSMGPAVVSSLKRVTDLPIEVHLMVTEPERFIQPFAKAGAARLIFHVEVVADVPALCAKIRDLGVQAGLALNPETSWARAREYLQEVDLVTIMTVHPGFGGQAFLTEILPKVSQASQSVTEGRFDVDIEVDGGIDLDTAPIARSAGADVFVAGSAVFGAEDPARAAKALLDRLHGSPVT